MTIREYQQQTPLTDTDLGSLELNLSHMVLGMCSELVELQEAFDNKDKVNVKEELGDIMWYTSNYANRLNIQLDIIDTNRNEFYHFKDKISLLANLTKRFVAYKKELDIEAVTIILNQIMKGVSFIAHTQQIAFSDILNRNIEKLRARFPNGFTQYDSLNRNLDNERKILEQ